eukprot:1083437-Pleurochrysis_carterae.AAC.1
MPLSLHVQTVRSERASTPIQGESALSVCSQLRRIPRFQQGKSRPCGVSGASLRSHHTYSTDCI